MRSEHVTGSVFGALAHSRASTYARAVLSAALRHSSTMMRHGKNEREFAKGIS